MSSRPNSGAGSTSTTHKDAESCPYPNKTGRAKEPFHLGRVLSEAMPPARIKTSTIGRARVPSVAAALMSVLLVACTAPYTATPTRSRIESPATSAPTQSPYLTQEQIASIAQVGSFRGASVSHHYLVTYTEAIALVAPARPYDAHPQSVRPGEPTRDPLQVSGDAVVWLLTSANCAVASHPAGGPAPPQPDLCFSIYDALSGQYYGEGAKWPRDAPSPGRAGERDDASRGALVVSRP